jgi:hypothetical protein
MKLAFKGAACKMTMILAALMLVGASAEAAVPTGREAATHVCATDPDAPIKNPPPSDERAWKREQMSQGASAVPAAPDLTAFQPTPPRRIEIVQCGEVKEK